MFEFASVIAAIITVIAVLRALLAWRFVRRARGESSLTGLPESLPRVAVFMPVRGVDDSLPEAIKSVLEQDYSNYEVRIIVDSVADESWTHVQNAVARSGADNVHVSALERREPTCSLVCNGLLQFMSEVEDSTDLITLCGSDMVVASNWMSQMVRALEDPETGCTLGNRWYVSESAGWGWMVRYLWNAVANIIAWHYRIPWGGTVCLRVADIRRSGLLDDWSRAMIEDIPIRSAMDRIDRSLRYVPELIVVNRESISLRSCISFVARQMFWMQTYSPNLLSTFLIPVVMGCGSLALIVMLVLGAAFGNTPVVAISSAALLVQAFLPLIMLCFMERSMRAMMRRRGEPTPPLPWSYFFKLPVAVILTQIIVAYGTICAYFQKTVQWRDVVYQVDGPFSARLISDTNTATQSPWDSELTSDVSK